MYPSMNKILTTGMVACCVFLATGVQAQTKKTPAKQPPVTSTLQQTMLRGKILYEKHCMVCHQKDGGGVMNLNPPLIRTAYVLGDKTRLINVLLKGLNEPLEIDGDVYVNPMPAQNFLTDGEVADVLSYVRNHFQNQASVITASEVKRVRAQK